MEECSFVVELRQILCSLMNLLRQILKFFCNDVLQHSLPFMHGLFFIKIFLVCTYSRTSYHVRVYRFTGPLVLWLERELLIRFEPKFSIHHCFCIFFVHQLGFRAELWIHLIFFIACLLLFIHRVYVFALAYCLNLYYRHKTNID